MVHVLEQASVHSEVSVLEATKHHLAQAGGFSCELASGGDGNPGGFIEWIAIDSSTDARESQGRNPCVVGKCQGASITGGEQLRFTSLAAMPHRPDGVNDIAGWETISLRQYGITGPAATEQAAFIPQLGSSCTMNRTAHTTARKECFIRGIHDGVDIQCGDVALNRLKRGGHEARRPSQSGGG